MPVAPETRVGTPGRLWLRVRPTLPWAALVLMLLVAIGLLVMLSLRDEGSRRQESADEAVRQAALEIRRELLAVSGELWLLGVPKGGAVAIDGPGASALMTQRPGVARLELRGPEFEVLDKVDWARRPPLFADWPRTDLDREAAIACAIAARERTSIFSRSYFVPLVGESGQEVLELCVPLSDAGRLQGFLVATIALRALLEDVATEAPLREFELSFVEADGTRLARAGGVPGGGRFIGRQVVDLPGASLILRADSASRFPGRMPGLGTAMVLGLSAALLLLVALLARDVRKRAQVEAALDEALAFRKALGDSLPTAVRARDIEGRSIFTNPALIKMLGFTEEELDVEVPPFWPPELYDEYLAAYRKPRSRVRRPGSTGLKEFEVVFMRKNGERFPARIYQAPLYDRHDRHVGWVSSVVDLSEQRRGEELSRQQQERLQAAARLATVGELASLVSHELNQPLSAISSYASGSLNLLRDPSASTTGDLDLRAMIGQALTRIADQAERAGRVIRSVHGFVRRRERHIEVLSLEVVLEAVLPLVRLQTAKSGARVHIDLPAAPPLVSCDRTMLEQVLLNLTRNALQAMEQNPPSVERLLTLRVRPLMGDWLVFSVIDTGPGIPEDVVPRMFTPFFTTKPEGMGMGLSLCRTVVEQQGGTLDFITPHADGRGVEFRFTLRSVRRPEPPAEAGAHRS